MSSNLEKRVSRIEGHTLLAKCRWLRVIDHGDGEVEAAIHRYKRGEEMADNDGLIVRRIVKPEPVGHEMHVASCNVT